MGLNAKQQALLDRLSGSQIEPCHPIEANRQQMAEAYNYYDTRFEHNEILGWVSEYVEASDHPQKVAILSRMALIPKSAPTVQIGGQVASVIPAVGCYIARQINIGTLVPISSKNYLNEILDRILAKPIEFFNCDSTKPVGSLKYIKIDEKFHIALSDFESEIVDHYTQKRIIPNVVDWLRRKGIEHNVSRKIAEYYKPHVTEFRALLKGTDEQVVEAYRHLTLKMKKEQFLFYQMIVDVCSKWLVEPINDRQLVTAKTITVKPSESTLPKKRGRPRKIQVSEASKSQSNSTVMFTPRGNVAVSITSDVITDHRIMFCINKKNYIIARYVAADGQTLKVVGKSLQGYDEALSTFKRVKIGFREITKKIAALKPSEGTEIYNNIKTQSNPARSRMSDYEIIKASV